MRDSFFRFHKCYVWDEFYKDLFIKLRAESKQFIVEVPDSIIFTEKEKYVKQLDYTYYLMAEDRDVLQVISNSLKKLKDNGYSVAVRPHPRYSDPQLIKELFEGIFIIEDGKKVSIEESVMRTRNAVSLYSTVLYQAYHNGVSIVIDDVSDSLKYNKLRELQYRLMYSDDKKLLSEIL